MKQNFKLIVALLVLILFANADLAMSQTVNMNRWIKIPVGSSGRYSGIAFKAAAAAANTPIRLVSGSMDTIITIDTAFSTRRRFIPPADTLRVYGDINRFDCSGNGYGYIKGALDASHNNGLIFLDCSSNEITSLDVRGLTALQELNRELNRIPSLDVSGFTALKKLDCSVDWLSSVNLTGCTDLEELKCSYTYKLTSLDVSTLTSLKILSCCNNKLTTLDVSGLTKLQELNCENNQYLLTSLNVSGCSALQRLYCKRNRIASLNLSGLNKLTDLDCDENQMTSLNLTGCTALATLTCRSNHLTSLNLSGLNALTELHCGDNTFTSLQLSGLPNLKKMTCNGSVSLTHLSISGLPALERLYCNNNGISSINISNCAKLIDIYCYGNKFSACGLDSLFHILPLADRYTARDISIDNNNRDSAVKHCRDTIARNRNWKVWNYNGGWGSISITNTTYDCPYFTVGVEEVFSDNISANIYPNPANDILNIESDEAIESLELYDILGRLVLSKRDISATESRVEVSSLSRGVYILKIHTAKGVGEYKILIE